MKVPLQLRRRAFSEPAVALLSPGSEASPLFRLCARLGLDPTGRLHEVEGGILLTLETPSARPFPGVIRLRSLSANLYVPVDAELDPALLDDEAQGLVHGRGLVFPPWGGVLSFDPLHPLRLSAWLVAEPAPRLDWRPFPDRPALAGRIEEILRELPEEAADTWLESTEDGIGSEAPRPDQSGPIATVAGRATLGAGRGLIWLGQRLGLKGLARIGAEWVGGAIQMAPRLSEAVLGRQAAAIRSLLREFREGDQDLALRRALPLEDSSGPARDPAGVGDQLPTRPFSYALAELLGHSSRRGSGAWFAGEDVLRQLRREYLKAAEDAQRRGDPRRAALIYGKLLKDYRMAAHSLSRAGLHRDAAILLLTKLNDPRAAAREFEAAGEVDRALRLYQEAMDHEAAGDLLVRVGDLDAALVEYRKAADRLVASEGGHLAAGRLLARKAGQPNLALEHYLAGWDQRPDGGAIACLIEATTAYAQAGSPQAILTLLDEVDAYHADTFSDGLDWVQFYHDLARLAGRPSLTAIREELLDRARLALAVRGLVLSMSGSPAGRIVSELFGRAGVWPPSLVRDADFAIKARAKCGVGSSFRPSNPGGSRRIRIGTGVVSAACAATGSAEVFVGFETGEVRCFRSRRSEVIPIASSPLPVAALAASGDGRSLVVLRTGGDGSGILSAHARSGDGAYALLQSLPVENLEHPWLTPVLPVDGEEIVGIWDGRSLDYLTVGSFVSWGSTLPTFPKGPPLGGLLLPWNGKEIFPFQALMTSGDWWFVIDPSEGPHLGTGLLWSPARPQRSPLRSVVFSWARRDPSHLEVVGLDGNGRLQWTEFRSEPESGRLEAAENCRSTTENGYLATTLIRSRVVAGVTASRIDWLRCGPGDFSLVSSVSLSSPTVVACFFSRPTGELIVVNSNGSLDRVVVPL